MCPTTSPSHSDFNQHSRISNEPTLVAQGAFSERKVSSFVASDSKYMLSYVLNFAGSKIQYFFILEKLETRLNIPGQYSKKLEHDFDVQT